ncbi:formate dehydrogenase accessory sulfurtransferase FdhD [Aquabacter sp. L1I39]|uniref:formate dehydrogenase accessory sulfurtransferase FdhD n=1 Tax=Aquabacter sp. L1I39 TaxID=2820278 RepID=UPI001ADB1C34|nr:formate dehydrogenase accessory sulfurtransferase FdhD [Aquabacter sp. L1I39]QTL04490.1 formate dehydrogenase accessory sulfurtransferase FdhD [Aquabacter sp. L1I39]
MSDDTIIPDFPEPSRRVSRSAWRNGVVSEGERAVPEETPVALTYNGTTQAVMMASPQDIADFALGFSLTESIIAQADDILSLDVIAVEDGIEARMWIAEEKMRVLSARRRHLAGPTGCGLCGVESLAEAIRPAAHVETQARLTPGELLAAMALLSPAQALNRETRAVHAAGYFEPERGLLAVCEDVGRHNALDKLVGKVAHLQASPSRGLLLLTSRVSIEMVQKAAVLGVGVIAAVSAPTSLAVRTAERAGITLCAIVRDDGFEVFTHPERIGTGPSAGQAHVA